MIRPGMIFGLARAEARLTRRLVRYWVFLSIAFGIGILGFIYYWWLHNSFSAYSATVGMLNPRYLLGIIGIYYLVTFLLGLILLGYDVRARDQRERMHEVVEALPCSNLELLLGRFLGILIPAWVPVVLIAAILSALGLMLGAPLQFQTLVTFCLAMAIPAYAFVLGLTFFVTLIVRHRLVAGVLLFAVVIGVVVVNFGFVPIWLLPAVDITGGFSMPSPSDITPAIIDGRGSMQRLSFLLAGLAMLVLAAAVHPRRDDASRKLTAGIGIGMLVLGLLANGWVLKLTLDLLDEKKGWAAAHEARRDDAAPDIRAMSGNVSIRPGKRLDLDLELRIAAPEDRALDSALFTLNPGLTVASVEGGSGGSLAFEQGDGLLEIDLPRSLQPGEETTLTLAASGLPDVWFAYIDSAFEPFTVNIREGNIFILGFEPGIFESGYVALLPGIRWLPASGAEMGRADPEVRPADFFDIDLDVELPEGWLVAGPGRRTEVPGAAGAGRVRFNFSPPAPVPEVALVAGELESRSVEVGGILIEALLDSSHTKNLEFFADAGGELRDWIGERLQEAADLGLPYPYDGLTVIEVPGALRGYAGGWRMDTTFTQPAMVLMRESGFPTARFDNHFEDPSDFEGEEGGLPGAKRRMLERFFENDFSGGNAFIAASRSFFTYLTAGVGPDGLPLDFVSENLTNRLVAQHEGFFSVHLYGTDMNDTINESIGNFFRGDQQSMTGAMIHTVTSKNEVWDQALEVSLADLDPWEAPKRALNVLTLKGGAMSRSMYDGLGRKKTGRFLAALRERRAGSAYDREDVLAAGEEVGEDLSDWLDVWINGTDLPGFITGDVRYDRISDAEDGAPRYQLSVVVRNEETTPGLLRMRYRQPEGSEWIESEPHRVEGQSALEIGMITSEPVRAVQVDPYLALNRLMFMVSLPALDTEKIVAAEPFIGAREAPYNPVVDDSIVVDDLDAGFSVVEAEGGSMLRFGGQGADDEETDQGLPVSQFGLPSRWSRRMTPVAHGKYRHTAALIKEGDGGRIAVFATEIPTSGAWELEYYLPRRPGTGGIGFGRRKYGSWQMTVVDDTGSQEVEFDAENGEAGWNTLGSFELADGEVRVEVPNVAEDGDFVIADAIRWRRAVGGPAAVDTE
jgi:hypothetical protein